MRSISRMLESFFETFLFNSRLIVILAVLGSLTSSVLMFIRGAILIVHSAKDFAHHWKEAHNDDLSIALISSVDSFLFATVLLIFAMGIYELFISKIDPASRNEDSRPNWLQIHSLDDLKGAVGKVILMILIVRLFESAVKMKYDHPLHLLYLGLAVLFVAAALYLQHLGHKHDKPHVDHYPKAKKDDDDKGHAPKREEHSTPDVAIIAPSPVAMGTMPQPMPVQGVQPPPYVPPAYAAPLASYPSQPPPMPMGMGAPQPPMQTMQSPYNPPAQPQTSQSPQPPQQGAWPNANPSHPPNLPNGPNGPRRW